MTRTSTRFDSRFHGNLQNYCLSSILFYMLWIFNTVRDTSFVFLDFIKRITSRFQCKMHLQFFTIKSIINCLFSAFLTESNHIMNENVVFPKNSEKWHVHGNCFQKTLFLFRKKIVQSASKTKWLKALKTEINAVKWVNEFVGFSNSSIRTRALILVNWQRNGTLKGFDRSTECSFFYLKKLRRLSIEMCIFMCKLIQVSRKTIT